MTFAGDHARPQNPRMSSPIRLEDYDSSSSNTDPGDTPRAHNPRSRPSFLPSSSTAASPRSDFLFPPTRQSGHSSVSSTANCTPVPSRSTSPLPQFFVSDPPSSCTSDSDSENGSPLIRNNRSLWWRENRQSWWSVSRRRRKRHGRFARIFKRWTRRVLRHPLFPRQPITIILTLILLSGFAIFLTLLLIYILNPDKEPLPWRAYCTVPSLSTPSDHLSAPSGTMLPPFPPPHLETLPPAGLFVGVFSIDSGFERRMLVRTTWASHPRSRDGAGRGDDGVGTSRTVVRFIMGQPRKDWERRVKLEMDTYNDIVILPMAENMNGGKTHTYFSWASINAWVPPVYMDRPVPPPQFSYSNRTTPPPALAPHDSFFAWEDQHLGKYKPWVRPDYVVKVDDDAFVMLAELESRLRLELHAKTVLSVNDTAPSTFSLEDTTTNSLVMMPESLEPMAVLSNGSQILDPLVYWGYMVHNRLHRFMAGELYALSWSLVEWVANDPAVKGLTRGAEDKQTAKWMKMHPRESEVRWASERCWIYDHPRSGTVYSHGFLFPSEVTRVKRAMMSYLNKTPQDVIEAPTPAMGGSPTPAAWSHSTVSTFGVRYVSHIPDLSSSNSVEALVEGSDMSMIREGSPMTPEYAWQHREGRKTRYEGNRVGGTVVVHFIKKHMWFLETALALLEGEEMSEAEKFQSHEAERAREATRPPAPLRAASKHRRW